MSQIEVNNTFNSVNVENTINTVDVDNSNGNIVIVPQEIIKIIEINTPGPQGPPGDPSPLTGSFVSIGVFNSFTSSYNTGSFTGSFIGDGSGLTGINASKWTSSFDGSISRDSNVLITGSLFLNFDGIENYFSVVVAGEEKLKVNEQGVLQLISQSVTPDPVPGGIFYSGSNEFFLGFEV